MSVRAGFEHFVHWGVKTVMATAIAIGVLALGAATLGGDEHLADVALTSAAASAPDDDTRAVGYFPAQFPAPDGPIGPHIDTF
jgi:hypothetical protein